VKQFKDAGGSYLRTKAFLFPLQWVQVSVQAGFGMKSAFLIDGVERRYPFYGYVNPWHIFDGVHLVQMDIDQFQNAYFPLDKATSFEVTMMDIDPKTQTVNSYTPIDFGITGFDDENWAKHKVGACIEKAEVERLLMTLHTKEQVLDYAVETCAAVRIQKVYRGWICRKKIAWNPNTKIGKGLELLQFRKLSL
jgi:hypothetical protein